MANHVNEVIPRRMEPNFIAFELSKNVGASGPTLRLHVARFPTTVEEYREFIEEGGYENRDWWSTRGWYWRMDHAITSPKYWGDPPYSASNLPVTGVSFWEAEAYANFRRAELPTEMEWYLFSSNGGDSRFPWGDDDVAHSRKLANLAFFGAFDEEHERLSLAPVDRSVASSSEAGVRDLIGNVAEWCIPGSVPELPTREMTGVLRGGASWHVPGAADSSFRDVVPLTVRDNQTGIRLIRREYLLRPNDSRSTIGWPSPPRRLGKSIRRPTKPFRQEGIPNNLSEATWRLRVHGDGVQPREFSLADLKNNFPIAHQDGLFVCVCRWGEHNTFTGVRLRDVLEECGVSLLAHRQHYLRQVSAEGPNGVTYDTTVSVRDAIEHDVILAWGIDGKDLSYDLGWPLRYIDFHRYGYKGVKCLSDLIITDELRRGWWEDKCQYDIDGSILPGTITVVGEDALRFDIERRGRVTWNHHTGRSPK